MAAAAAEVVVVPFFGQGHLLPSIELCNRLSSRNFKVILVISSNLSSSVPSSLRFLPLLHVLEIPSSLPPPPPSSFSPGEGNVPDPMQGHRHHHSQLSEGLGKYLSSRPEVSVPNRPLFAVVDVMMGWTGELFASHRIPTVGFFTSGACSAALELAMWKVGLEDFKPGEIRPLPGLPGDMALVESDIKQRPHGPPNLRDEPKGPGGPPGQGFLPPPGGPGPKFMGPPKPGQQPPWLEEAGGSVALMFNTCDDLEGPFIEYIAEQVNKPVWGVGPLLPETYWKSTGSLLHDQEIRANRQSSVTENDVIRWLDKKPCGSVLYVAFGSEVGPTLEEYPQLAAALEESNHPFIWAIQHGAGRRGPPRAMKPGLEPGDDKDSGYFPTGLDQKVGDRGLIIRGWAPQLLILSHPSTGGFLSHCGWNSTVEAVGRGVPFLTWPIRGDQYHNAKLLINHLKVGLPISKDMSRMVVKGDIIKGIESLMSDTGVKERAAALRVNFEHGFPRSSNAALDEFARFTCRRSGGQ
ncbi:hypothetical protein MLD38_009963 [Melastoma candidum]|uniref:Uncharacterized protein n=1 Tax=Melastoma candidum TaxID=119954 RepID=A0ACB9R052_9MYRT|nr:hypothetical protein MLD38_009963 [Melastoma candidum]